MSNKLNSVYNHYLTMYAPKSVTKYDTHKKSELRSIYNSIVKINKESPWYLPTRNADVQKYAIGLKENARTLHNTIASLGGIQESEEELLSKKAASSSNEDILTATYIGKSDSLTEIPSYLLEVRALAMPQENRGRYLPNEAVSLPADTYSFDVQINEMNYEFQFSISAGESNTDIQNRLSRLINNSNIGLNAHVDEDGGKSSLIITSDATGLPGNKDILFSITDDLTSKAKGCVEYFGLDYISRMASNSDLSVNGEPMSTRSNEFTIDKIFDVTLKSTTPEDHPVTLTLKTDVESLTENISRLADGYNAFLRDTSSYFGAQPRSRALFGEINRIRAMYSPSFEQLGLTSNEDGTLTLDSAKLEEAISSSQNLNQTFLPLIGFSKSLIQKTNQISLDPMTYVDKKIVAYKNPTGPNYASPYITSAYSGMMFNSYC